MIQYVGFPNGFYYRRFPGASPRAAVVDVQNMILEQDRAVLRSGSALAYTTELDPGAGTYRIVQLRQFWLPGGRYRLVGFGNSIPGATSVGYIGFMQRLTEPGSGTPYLAYNIAPGLMWHGDAAAYGDALWLTTGASCVLKHVPTSEASSDQYAGCWPPLRDPNDDGVDTAESDADAPGLGEGHYWYAISLLYGYEGLYGESTIQAVGEACVPHEHDGEGEVTNASTVSGMPILGDVCIPSGDRRYYGAWGRRLYRTKAGGDRNGPYYFILQKDNLTDVTFTDRVHDSDLSSAVIGEKYLDDDTMLPPADALLCLLHENRMVYGCSPWNRSRIWWSQVGTPDLVPVGNATDILPDETLPITGMASFRGSLWVWRENTISGVEVGTLATVRTITTSLGCLSLKSFAVGEDAVYYLSPNGPARFDGGQPELLGGSEIGRRICEYLEDYGTNLACSVGCFDGRHYYLAYGDRRDEPLSGGVNTRMLVWNVQTNSWTIWTGLRVGAMCYDRTGDRVLYADSRNYSKIMVLGVSASTNGTCDYNVSTAGASVTAGVLRVGNLIPSDAGDLVVPISWRAQAFIPGRVGATGLSVTPYYDGTAGTGGTLYTTGTSYYGGTAASVTAATAYPTIQRGRFRPYMTRSVELEFKNPGSSGAETDIGPWAIYGVTAEIGKAVK